VLDAREAGRGVRCVVEQIAWDNEWIEDAHVMDNNCQCGCAATMRRIMGLTWSLGRGLAATDGDGGGDEEKRRQQALSKSNVASHATKR
jgi:hypothetical protein